MSTFTCGLEMATATMMALTSFRHSAGTFMRRAMATTNR